MNNSCCINLGHIGPDDVQVTIISYNIYPTKKLLVTPVLSTLVTSEQVAKEKRTPTFNEVIRLGIGLHRTTM